MSATENVYGVDGGHPRVWIWERIWRIGGGINKLVEKSKVSWASKLITMGIVVKDGGHRPNLQDTVSLYFFVFFQFD